MSAMLRIAVNSLLLVRYQIMCFEIALFHTSELLVESKKQHRHLPWISTLSEAYKIEYAPEHFRGITVSRL